MRTSNETSYGAGYPFAIEEVAAYRAGVVQQSFNLIVKAAALKTFRAIGKSGAVINTDAADGRDITPRNLLKGLLQPYVIKKVRKYLEKQMGKQFSRLKREKQESLIMSIAELIAPEQLDIALELREDAIKNGVFGAVPVFTMAEIGRKLGERLAKEVDDSVGLGGLQKYLDGINQHADDVQKVIQDANFGLNDRYWGSFHRRYYVDGVPLVDVTKNVAATADTGGAMTKRAAKRAKRIAEASTMLKTEGMTKAAQQLEDNGVDNFRLIVKAAGKVDLAPGVTIPKEELADLISVDIYDGDEQLLVDVERWLNNTMGKMQNVSEDAIQRGIKVVQRGLREGRGVDYIASQLSEEMEITFRRARNTARNEIGNHAWNYEYANARAGGMRLYRWHGMLDERERKLHVERENKSYDPLRPPSDGNPGQPYQCRCYPEWLFERAAVAAAEAEIAKRSTGITRQ